MAVKNSTRPPKNGKPDRPDGFPLFAHATKRWAKKIRGKLHYFGPWSDPEGALEKYVAQRDDLHAGRTPRVSSDGLTVKALVNKFLTTKKLAVRAGELAPRTFRDYYHACARVIDVLGGNRLVSDLAADDFQRLKGVMVDTMGLASRKVEIQRTKTLFKYAYDEGLITQPIRYGTAFAAPSKMSLEKDRQAKPSMMFEAAEIRAMLGAALPQHKAMIYLGINCGFGNNDIATLPLEALDLEGGWISYPRPKTAVRRRCWLWPETIQAIRDYLPTRATPKDAANASLVFLTYRGNPWVQLVVRKKDELETSIWQDSVTCMCRELLDKIGIKRRGLNFYCLRRTFETIGGDSCDQIAVDHVMGHSPASSDMGAVYRQRIFDHRLQAVVEHVRDWLFRDGRRPS